jgi:trk system potassium uptake protein TrkA
MVGDISYFSSIPEKIPEMVQLMGYTFDRDRMIVISGGGRIARMVARGALKREISTTILRRDRKRAEMLAAEFPSAVVLQGDVTDESILREAGVESATSFIAATDDQETNLLSSVVAKRLGAGRVITLVDNPAYGSLVEGLDIDADVSPRQAAVSEILRFVRGRHFEEVASLPGDEIEVAVVEVDEESRLSHGPIRKLGLPRGVLITAVATADGVMIPHGDDVLPVGSRAVLFTLGKVAEKAAKFLEVRA